MQKVPVNNQDLPFFCYFCVSINYGRKKKNLALDRPGDFIINLGNQLYINEKGA